MRTKSLKLGTIFIVFALAMVFNLPTTAENVSKEIVSKKNVTRDNTKIDINSATKEQLQSIKGIGESYAARIVEYRQNNGPFQTTEDIMKVKGIGEKLYEKIKDQLMVKKE